MLFLISVFLVLLLSGILVRISEFRARNIAKRKALLKSLGLPETAHKKLVGFFHPYW